MAAAAAPSAPGFPQNNWMDEELAAYQQKQAEAAAAAAQAQAQAHNPYASPGMAGMHGMNQYGSPNMGGLWREGQLLVMDRNARLPNICVKSGQPTGRFLIRNLSWQPPWLRAMAFVFGWLIYAILVASYGKKATIQIALSDEWFQRRTVFLLIGWIGCLTGLAIGGIGMAIGIQMDNSELVTISIFVGAILLAACGITSSYGARMVWADLITERHIWVGGVCESLLQQLPPWTGGRPH